MKKNRVSVGSKFSRSTAYRSNEEISEAKE